MNEEAKSTAINSLAAFTSVLAREVNQAGNEINWAVEWRDCGSNAVVLVWMIEINELIEIKSNSTKQTACIAAIAVAEIINLNWWSQQTAVSITVPIN